MANTNFKNSYLQSEMIYQSPLSWQGVRGYNRLQGLQQEGKYFRTLPLLLTASCIKKNHKGGTDANLHYNRTLITHEYLFRFTDHCSTYQPLLLY